MDYEETMVNAPDGEEAMDDLSIDGIVEEVEESSASLDDFLDEGDKGEEEEQADEQPGTAAKEPGYVRKRVEKAVARERAAMQAEFDRQIAEMKDQFEAQMAPFRAKLIEDEAQELVRTRKISDIETAREFVRMKQGQPTQAPAPAEEPSQPRQANGQFAAKEDPATSARISMLQHQLDMIGDQYGADAATGVTTEFTNNPEIKRQVIAGKMDFHDVYRQMTAQKKRPPSPMRSPNGANGNVPNVFENMSSEQLKRLEDKVNKEGVRINLR